MSYTITVDKSKCIGCGACASVCTENWDVVEEAGDYKAKPKNSIVKELGCNKDAEEVCPVKAISIKKE